MARKPTEKQLYTMKNELLRERFEQVTMSIDAVHARKGVGSSVGISGRPTDF